jgi:hypothetical protein
MAPQVRSVDAEAPAGEVLSNILKSGAMIVETVEDYQPLQDLSFAGGPYPARGRFSRLGP